MRTLFRCCVIFTIFLGVISWKSLVFADYQQAERLMNKSDCLACHTKAQKLVGPSFKEISKKYNKKDDVDKLVTSVIKGGSGNWGAMPMPAHPTMSKNDVKKIIEGILGFESSEDTTSQNAVAGKNIVHATPADIAKGRDLFQGKIRLKNRGAACNACHHVKNDAVIGGGILAKDLTSVFSRMGEPGVRSILGSPPFAVMQQAYKDKPLTENEIFSLVSFLNDADQKHLYQRPRDYGMGLFLSGIFGAVLLMIFFFLVGARRKKKSVNQDLYDRQIKSEWE